MQVIIGSMVTLALALSLTPLVRGAARRLGVVAAPRIDRWHRKPTALLGGVAIYLAFAAGCLLFAWQTPGARLILAAGTLLFIAGLVDDLVQVKPYTKLVVQLIVAALVVFFSRRLHWTYVEPVNIFITIFWLVGITNAVNLLDNMDGLAGGVSAIACVFLTITLLLNGQAEQAMLPALLGGASLGFLVFNFRLKGPASVFMGDCGALFLGFAMGAMALLSEYDRSRNLGTVLLTPVLIMLIPIFDTCMVTLTRKLSGRPISQGGRDHTSHRLVALGVSERRAVLLLYALAIAAGLLAVIVRGMRIEALLLLVPVFALALLFIGLYLSKAHIYEEGKQPVGNTVLKTLIDFRYKRRVMEILLDVALVTLAYYGAFVLRFDGHMSAEQFMIFRNTLPLVIGVQMLSFLLCGFYRGLWRYMTVDDFLEMVKPALVGAGANAAMVYTIYGARDLSPTIFVLFAMLLAVSVWASRSSFRLLRRLIVGPAGSHPNANPNAISALIYGAGDRSEFLLREILDNPDYQYRIVGFIDDDPRKVGRLIHGRRIFNARELPELIHRHGVSEVLVSSAKIPESRLDQLRGTGIYLKRMSVRIESDHKMRKELQSASNF
jgi:UDP-GlcNAc:undecaprenyl-phosphate GlcNAc-1-phosphate transferase